MNISVLGIGTELTSGQILNKNGQWISSRLKRLGIPTSMHLVVPDEEHLILQSLQFCWEHSEILFVTGGLGPTTDDFTRDVISKWMGRELRWDQGSWQHLENRLNSRGYTVKEIQKQQCFFPEGADVLLNRAGTANAFHLSHQGKDIYVLPGPPNEISTVWEDHIDSSMKARAQKLDPQITVSWDTIGVGESDVADRTEKALKNCPYEKGYRVHPPYVEFKITFLRSQIHEAQKWIDQVEHAISSITVLRNGEDPAQKLAACFEQYPQVVICDEYPGSFLLHRLFPFCKRNFQLKKINFVTSLDSIALGKVPVDFSTLVLHLKADSVGFGRASATWRGQTRSQIFMSPYKSLLLREREPQFYAEMALIFWMKEVFNGPAIPSNSLPCDSSIR